MAPETTGAINSIQIKAHKKITGNTYISAFSASRGINLI